MKGDLFNDGGDDDEKPVHRVTLSAELDPGRVLLQLQRDRVNKTVPLSVPIFGIGAGRF